MEYVHKKILFNEEVKTVFLQNKPYDVKAALSRDDNKYKKEKKGQAATY